MPAHKTESADYYMTKTLALSTAAELGRNIRTPGFR
jgi:hypothetical protein